MVQRQEVREAFQRFQYEGDRRQQPPTRYHKRNFKIGWNYALQTGPYESVTELTWQNLGNRYAQEFGPTPEPDEIFDIVVDEGL